MRGAFVGYGRAAAPPHPAPSRATLSLNGREDNGARGSPYSSSGSIWMERTRGMTNPPPPSNPPPNRPSRATEEDQVWTALRQLTAARIGLRRTGASIATGPLLDFRLAHARARDAVHEPLDETRLVADLATLGTPVITVASSAGDKQRYLLRPDLGRRLAPDAEAKLAPDAFGHDVVFVVTDGLSARAVHGHARRVLTGVLAVLRADAWRIAPIVVVRHGRVAVGDPIAAALHADCVAVLIGERPGLRVRFKT